MQLSALLPVLALIAAPLADARDHGRHATRELGRHAKHVRAAERMEHAIERREQLARENPPAVRRVKRASKTCRVRPSASASSTAAASASAVSAAASSAAPTVSSAPASATSEAPAPSSAADPASSAAWSQAPAPSSEAPAPAQSSAAPQPANPAPAGGLTPRGKKAGTSGTETVGPFGDKISWYWNYGSTPDTETSTLFMPTVWGDGSQGDQDWSRLNSFKAITTAPEYIQGFYEPDCSPPMSSAIDPSVAAPLWNSLIAPWRAKGSVLVSPGMCKQADEDWLTPFKNQIGEENMWDVTSVHINKLDMDGVRKVLDHYWNTYGKPIWVTEFACVDDVNGFTPCTDQGQINNYINQIVPLLEADSRVYAYSISTGMGLGDTWPSFKDGALTETGHTYLNAISAY